MSTNEHLPARDDEFVLGVDLDNVCGDYTDAFRASVAADWGVDPATLEGPESYDFSDWGISSRDQFESLHRRAVDVRRIFKTMKPIPGASETLWRLSEDCQVRIRIITYRLCVPRGHKRAAADTVAWLDEHGIPYRDLAFLAKKDELGADCYIDDSPGNIAALRGTGAAAVVFDQPFNSGVSGPRARNWADVELIVRGMLEARGAVLPDAPPTVLAAASADVRDMAALAVAAAA